MNWGNIEIHWDDLDKRWEDEWGNPVAYFGAPPPVTNQEISSKKTLKEVTESDPQVLELVDLLETAKKKKKIDRNEIIMLENEIAAAIHFKMLH